MLHTSMALVPAAVGTPGGSQMDDSGQPNGQEPTIEELGKWIWIGDTEPSTNSYLQARKTFKLRSKPLSATLKASANSRYKLFVNGRYVGKGPVRSPHGYSYFDTHDITHFLDKGNNVIAFLVHHVGENTYSSPAGKPGLLCKAEVELKSGVEMWATDETWKVRRAAEWLSSGARLSRGLGYQEIYDCSNAMEGWTEAKFREKGWQDAVIVGDVPANPWGEVLARQIPLLREERILPRAVVSQNNAPEVGRDVAVADIPDIMAAAELNPLKAGSVSDAESLLQESGSTQVKTPRGDRGVVIILDFGREVFGNVEVGIGGSGTGCIDLGYAEQLSGDHVKPNAGETKYTDRILLKKGRLDWQSFEPRAFRYMQIEFRRCSKPVALEYIRVNQTTYPVTNTGTFECSDDILNQVFRAGVLTAQLCMEDTFIDSPLRERAQWWADARVMSRTAYYAFNDTKLLAQGLRQIASSQDSDGSILGLYPAGVEMLVPDYALLWVFSILEHFAFSDDDTLVRELYPVVQRLMKWFAKYEDCCGLLSGVHGRLLIDHADLERKGEVTSLNCLYYHALQVSSMLASIAGNDEQAQEYLDAATRVRIAINKYMYVPRKGLYAECRQDGELIEKFSRQTNILAALFDLTDQYQKAGIFRQLANGQLPEITTPYFGSLYLEALYTADYHSEALDYLRRKWGDVVKTGATTLAEDFVAEGCLCHGSAVAPVRDLIAEYVGIKPVLGTHRFSVTPHPANLKWARGSVETAHAPLSVEWRTIRNRLDIYVNVPEGLKVDVFPPGPVNCSIMVDGKKWPSRFVTLSGGGHEIRISAPRPERISTYDEAAIPLLPHVEVLDRGIRVGRGRSIVLEPRRRSRRGKTDEPLEVHMDTAAVGEEPETVEAGQEQAAVEVTEDQLTRKRGRRSRGGRGRGKRAAQTAETPVEEQAQSDVIEEPTVEAGAEVAEEAPSKRRRRSRGGRGRGKAAREAAAQEAPATVEEPLAEAIPAEVSPEAAAAEPSEEAAPTRRRRRSRGGRGRRRSREASGEATVAPEGEEPSAEMAPEQTSETAVVEAAADVPVGETAEGSEETVPTKRRRRSRGGRGRRRSNASASEAEAVQEPTEAIAEPDTEAAEMETTPEAEVGEAAEGVEPTRRRRRSRGGRGRRRSNGAASEVAADQPEGQGEVQVQAAESVVEPTPEPVEPGEEPAPTRRRRSRGGRGRGKSSVETAESAGADQAVTPEPAPERPAQTETVQTEAVTDEVKAAPRKRTSRGGRSRAKATAAGEDPVAEAAAVVEPVAAEVPTEQAAEEPKKKRRTYTRRKKAETAEPPADTPQSESEG